MEGIIIKNIKNLNISTDKIEKLKPISKEYENWETFKQIFKTIFKKQEGSHYLNIPNKAIILKDAFQQKLGIEGTAKQQSKVFYETIKRECKRSKSYRKIISLINQERTENEKLIPIEFHLGKNCTSFIDSAADWTMDMTELEMFPIDLQKHSTGKIVGMNQGEILMHVLEERFYMQFPDTNFEDSHVKCLTVGSFQSNYRREMGSEGTSVYFDLHEKYCGQKNRLLGDFFALSTCGSITNYYGCEIVKAKYPIILKDYDPSLIKGDIKMVDFNGYVDNFSFNSQNRWRYVLKEKGCPKVIETKMLEHLLKHRHHDQNVQLEKICKSVKSWGVGFFLLKTWRSISAKWKIVYNLSNLKILLDIEHQRKTLFTYFATNIQKLYGWEYDEEKWLNEKKLMSNEWIDLNISQIRNEIQPKIVQKLVSLKKMNTLDAQNLSDNILSQFDFLF